MLDMNLPWWELILRASAVYSVLLIMVRVSGKRTIGQFTPFDLLVVMLLSESVSNSLTGGDESLAGGLLAALTLIVLNVLIAYITSRNKKIAEMVDGTAMLIGRDGRIYLEKLKQARVSEADVEHALREADCDLVDMKCAFLESDGKISIMKK